jgi:serine/threonine-protein kinase
MLAGIALVALACAALAGAWFLTRDRSDGPARASPTPAPAPAVPAAPRRTTVPRVVGYKETRALVVLGEAHLTPKIVRRETKRPTGTVVSQRPVDGTEVDRRDRVTIVVDGGQPARALPELTGQPYADAVALLRARGLEPRKTTVTTDAVPGTVVDQAPGAGTRLERGATVVLSVAKARPAVTQPPARTTTAPARKTQPPAHTTAPRRAPPAKAPTTMPDLVGLPQTQAWAALQKAGLLPSVLYVPSQEPADTVVAQAKPAGTMLTRGAHVQVNVSRGPNAEADRAVPDVLGRDEQTARQRLEAAGFTVLVLDQQTSDPAQDGRVVDEQPVSGARAPAGSQVTIFVGRSA